jgi:hypothetical protein
MQPAKAPTNKQMKELRESLSAEIRKLGRVIVEQDEIIKEMTHALNVGSLRIKELEDSVSSN